MTTLALELLDAGIRWACESGATGPVSPGYALWQDGTIAAGEAAWRRAREKPRFVHHRFWQDLDTEPLGRPFPRDLSAADLAHAHLSEIQSTLPDDITGVLLAIPGCFSAHQLGLILGIARACDLPVAGLVDAAAAATPVAVAAAGHPGQRFLHLDLHLHRVVLTELEMTEPPSRLPHSGVTGGAREAWATVIRRRVKVGDGAGLVALQDAWAQRIAELFVHATRFDPLHSAASEQALYRRLPEWLEAIRDQELIEVTLGPDGKERSIELTRPDLVDAVDSFYDSLQSLVLSMKRAGENVTLLLARGLAELPGLEPRLRELRGVTTLALPAGAAASGALLAQDQILAATGSGATGSRATGSRATGSGATGPGSADGTSALPFVTRLSFEAPPAQAEPTQDPAAAEPARPCPTHLVRDGLAYPITEHPFLLGAALDGEPGLELEGRPAGISGTHCSVVRRGTAVVVKDHSADGSFVNGERVDGEAALQVGDRLRLGTPAIELELIAVVEIDHCAPPGRPDRSRPSGATPPGRPDGTP